MRHPWSFYYAALDVGNVDTKGGVVTITHGKGGRDRVTFLSTRARLALRKYLATRPGIAQDAPLWMSERTRGDG